MTTEKQKSGKCPKCETPTAHYVHDGHEAFASGGIPKKTYKDPITLSCRCTVEREAWSKIVGPAYDPSEAIAKWRGDEFDSEYRPDPAFTKYDAGKPDLALWPPRAFVAVGRVLTYGAKKYTPDNWRKVDSYRRYSSAALRHIFAYLGGEKNDPESGEHHLAHAVCCLVFLLELEEEGIDTTGDKE